MEELVLAHELIYSNRKKKIISEQTVEYKYVEKDY